MSGTYGVIVTAEDVASAAQGMLETWMGAYIHELCRQAGIEPLDVPLWRRMTDTASLLADEFLPAGLVIAPRTRFVPGSQANVLGGDFTLNVTVASRGRDHEETAAHNALYRAAVRAALAQHQDLGGLATTCLPVREDQEALGQARQTSRTVLAGTVQFSVQVDHVLDLWAAPQAAPADPSEPPQEPPDTTSVSVTVDRKESV